MGILFANASGTTSFSSTKSRDDTSWGCQITSAGRLGTSIGSESPNQMLGIRGNSKGPPLSLLACVLLDKCARALSTQVW